jgi:hypothetical protein
MQRLLWGHLFELTTLTTTKGTTGGRQNQARNVLDPFTPKALPHSTGFAVNGQQTSASLPGALENEASRYHEGFLVCHRHVTTCVESSKRRHQADSSHESVDDNLDAVSQNQLV